MRLCLKQCALQTSNKMLITLRTTSKAFQQISNKTKIKTCARFSQFHSLHLQEMDRIQDLELKESKLLEVLVDLALKNTLTEVFLKNVTI